LDPRSRSMGKIVLFSCLLSSLYSRIIHPRSTQQNASESPDRRIACTHDTICIAEPIKSLSAVLVHCWCKRQLTRTQASGCLMRTAMLHYGLDRTQCSTLKVKVIETFVHADIDLQTCCSSFTSTARNSQAQGARVAKKSVHPEITAIGSHEPKQMAGKSRCLHLGPSTPLSSLRFLTKDLLSH